MSNEVVLRSGKTMRLGDVEWVVTEPVEVPLGFPDLLVDTRVINGNLHLTLGTTRVEGNITEIAICTRIRMDLVFAQLLRQTLDDMIKSAVQPADKSKTN